MATTYEQFVREARGERGGLFDPGRPVTVARAAGWADLFGGAAAPGGALALGWPAGQGSFVALQPVVEPGIRVRVAGAEHSLALAELVEGAAPREYADVAGRVAALAPPGQAWWAPLLGAWAALMREEFVRFPGGARLLLRPADGPGAAASVAAAAAQALVSAYGVRIAPRELAMAVQVALARVAGLAAPALGPLVSTCGPAGSLLLVHQQPAGLWGDIHLPPGAALWALRVGDGPAWAGPQRRLAAATAMAYRMVAHAAGLSPAAADRAWRGYLAGLGVAAFEGRYRELLPAELAGAEFLARYGWPPHWPPVEPGQRYPLRAAAALAVEEQMRTRLAAALLRAAASRAQREDDLHLVGDQMARSHWAQRAAGLADPHADQLARLVEAAGNPAGLFGARAPAWPSGASLLVLGRADAEPALAAIAAAYASACGQPVTIFGGSGPGASPAGTREI